MSTTTEPDCGSSSCIFSAKGGMRTNGPCRCMENAGFHGSAVMAAKQMLREVLLLRAELAALKAAHAWIKTSERKPEVQEGDCCDVLAVVSEQVLALNYTNDDSVHPWVDEFSNLYQDYEVTHWMPLPEAPK